MIYGYYCSLEHISIFHKRGISDHILASISIISVS